MTTVPLEMELKAGNEHLDNMLKDEDRCLECIYREKVNGRGRQAGQAAMRGGSTGLGKVGANLALLQCSVLLTSPSFSSQL